MPRTCAKSAHDPAAYALLEEMGEDDLANFLFSTKKDSCTTVCTLISKHGVRQQPTTTTTRDGATVFQNVSFLDKKHVFCIGINMISSAIWC